MHAPTAVRHADRRLAVSQHAVDRVRERANVHFLDDERVRLLVAEACLDALDEGTSEAHYVRGQERVLVAVLGCELYAVLGEDTTGWGRGPARRAVVTVLTPAQVAARVHG